MEVSKNKQGPEVSQFNIEAINEAEQSVAAINIPT